MGSTVNDLAEEIYGFSTESDHGRFARDGWLPQGETDLRCGLCGHPGTVVFRKHYVVDGDVYRGRVHHYWAIACPSCKGVVWLTKLEPELRNAYSQWGEDHEFTCPECDELTENAYLVLANSRKMGAHCVAVVDTDGNWVRPVSDAHEGALVTDQCWLEEEDRALRPLDVVEASFGRTAPRAYQPEDRKTPTRWELLDPQPSSVQIRSWLDRTVDHDADFIGRGEDDRISETGVAEYPLDSSLALVVPTVSEWRMRRTIIGNRQIRVRFTLDGVCEEDGEPIEFDLAVTDPAWEENVRDRAGETTRAFTSEELGMSGDDQVFFTLSVGEPFRGDHYKLVAAVILS